MLSLGAEGLACAGVLNRVRECGCPGMRGDLPEAQWRAKATEQPSCVLRTQQGGASLVWIGPDAKVHRRADVVPDRDAVEQLSNRGVVDLGRRQCRWRDGTSRMEPRVLMGAVGL